MNAIPTLFKGVQFRSRLEAKWAAFFDNINWRWEYEPVDRDGWIPDFVIWPGAVDTKPLLADVKPILDQSGFETRAKEIRQLTNDPVLLLGACLPEQRFIGFGVFDRVGPWRGDLRDDVEIRWAWREAGNLVQWVARGARGRDPKIRATLIRPMRKCPEKHPDGYFCERLSGHEDPHISTYGARWFCAGSMARQ